MQRTIEQGKTSKVLIRQADIDLADGPFPVVAEVLKNGCDGVLDTYEFFAVSCSNMVTMEMTHVCGKTTEKAFKLDAGTYRINLKSGANVFHSFDLKILSKNL